MYGLSLCSCFCHIFALHPLPVAKRNLLQSLVSYLPWTALSPFLIQFFDWFHANKTSLSLSRAQISPFYWTSAGGAGGRLHRPGTPARWERTDAGCGYPDLHRSLNLYSQAVKSATDSWCSSFVSRVTMEEEHSMANFRNRQYILQERQRLWK